MKFTVEITDPAKLAGITAARAAHNAALPDAFEEVEVEPAVEASEGVEAKAAVTERRAVTPKPGTLATDAAYVQHVMDKAAESYAVATQSTEAQLEQTRAELQAERQKVAELEGQLTERTR
jgi:hypothetical protein